jgi:hypothetical protein
LVGGLPGGISALVEAQGLFRRAISQVVLGAS